MGEAAASTTLTTRVPAVPAEPVVGGGATVPPDDPDPLTIVDVVLDVVEVVEVDDVVDVVEVDATVVVVTAGPGELVAGEAVVAVERGASVSLITSPGAWWRSTATS